VRRNSRCAITVGFGVVVLSTAAMAQLASPDGAVLFRQQCAVCHTLNAGDPPRQGPTLDGIYGRKAGRMSGFTYSSGFSALDIVWDDAHLDTYLTNPQAMIPGAMMVYRQPKAPVREAIIAFLKEQH
jgi:cytochrome c